MTKLSFCLTVRDFKEKKEHEAIDWESTKDKYERIKERFVEIFLMARKARIPTQRYSFYTRKYCVHNNKLCSGYRKTLDTKRKSRGGRLAAFFHDKYTEIWSGSHAVESMSSGIQTHENGTTNIDMDENAVAEEEV